MNNFKHIQKGDELVEMTNTAKTTNTINVRMTKEEVIDFVIKKYKITTEQLRKERKGN